MTTPDVSLKLSADGTAVVSELKKVRGEVDSFAGGVKKAAALAATAFSLDAIAGFAKELIDAADALDDAAKRVNVTAESLQGLRLAAEDFGGSADTMDRALQELQGSLGKATLEGGKAAAAFERIGLSAEELQGLGTDGALLEISDAVSKLGSDAERAALAQEFFGRSGKDLVPLLRDGRTGIEDLTEGYRKAGLILSGETIEALGEAERSLRFARTATSNLASEFLGGFAPALVAIGGNVRSAAEAFGGLNEIGGKVGATLIAAFEIIENGIRSLQGAFFGLAAAGARVLQALTFGDVSESFAASVDANLTKAEAALAQVKSIEQIQASILAQLEAARGAATAGGGPAAGGPGLGAAETLAKDVKSRYGFDEGPDSSVFANPFEDEERNARILENARNLEAEITAASEEELNRRLELYSSFSDFYLQITGSRIEQELAYEEMKNQSWGSILGSAVGAFAASNEKMAKIAQGVAIAKVVYSTATAVMERIAAFDYAGAAKAAVMGAANVARIKATKFSGSVVSGGESFPAGAAGGGGAPANDVFQPQNGQSAFEQRAIRVEVVGQFTDQSGQVIADMLAKQVKERDLVIIEPGTRQARELQGA